MRPTQNDIKSENDKSNAQWEKKNQKKDMFPDKFWWTVLFFKQRPQYLCNILNLLVIGEYCIKNENHAVNQIQLCEIVYRNQNNI